MKKILTTLIAVSAITLTSASAFTVITGSVIEFTSPDDLLLDAGTSVIAVDSFGNADSTVNGVTFFTDRFGLGSGATAEGIVSSGGVTVTTGLVNQIDNWANSGGGTPGYVGGTPGSAPALAEIMRDIRWANAADPGGNTTINVGVTGLAPNSLYNIQLLFNEGLDRDRRFDIGVNGLLAVDDFDSEGGNGVWTASNGFAYSGNFSSGAGGMLDIVIGQEPFPGDPNNTPFGGADNNAILQGIIVHTIPEPGTGALFGLGLVALFARRRRR